jgi:hypothetical protein
MGFVFWLGRMTLWVLFFPLGIWRSLRHHRKKGVKQMRRELKR